MVHAGEVVDYGLAIMIAVGIGFMIWVLVCLRRESRPGSREAAQSQEMERLRR